LCYKEKQKQEEIKEDCKAQIPCPVNLERERNREDDQHKEAHNGGTVQDPFDSNRGQGRPKIKFLLLRNEVRSKKFSRPGRKKQDSHEPHGGNGKKGPLVDLLNRLEDEASAVRPHPLDQHVERDDPEEIAIIHLRQTVFERSPIHPALKAK
jgi:hypothetical protein